MRRGTPIAFAASLLFGACDRVHDDSDGDAGRSEQIPGTGRSDAPTLGGLSGSTVSVPSESRADVAGTIDAGTTRRPGADTAPGTDGSPRGDAGPGSDPTPGADADSGADAALNAAAAPNAAICADAAWDTEPDDSGVKPAIAWRSSVGTACAGESDCGCHGAMCLIAQTLYDLGSDRVLRYSDGYCTAYCKSTPECGHGRCPFADAFSRVDIPEDYHAAIDDLLAHDSLCFETCTAQDDCRRGYQCTTLASVFTGGNMIAGAATFARSVLQREMENYCLPVVRDLSSL